MFDLKFVQHLVNKICDELSPNSDRRLCEYLKYLAKNGISFEKIRDYILPVLLFFIIIYIIYDDERDEVYYDSITYVEYNTFYSEEIEALCTGSSILSQFYSVLTWVDNDTLYGCYIESNVKYADIPPLLRNDLILYGGGLEKETQYYNQLNKTAHTKGETVTKTANSNILYVGKTPFIFHTEYNIGKRQKL